MDTLKNAYYYGNEQMFRTGISIEKVKAIACNSEKMVVFAITSLREAGITEINGRLIEEVVILAHNYVDFVKISQGESLEDRKTTAQILADNAIIQQQQ